MARHKHPEQTVEKILDVSHKLFMEKGYDKTTIQDIIDAVGMSKGIIYYHFKSKEEVFDAVMKRQFSEANDTLAGIIESTDAPTARERLTKIVDTLSTGSSLEEIDSVLLAQVRNPQFIIAGMQEAAHQDAPIFSKLMQDGVEDGSLTVENPLETSEVLLFLLNIWCNPLLFGRDRSDTESRLRLVQKIMCLLGADIVSEQAIAKLLDGYQGGYREEPLGQ